MLSFRHAPIMAGDLLACDLQTQGLMDIDLGDRRRVRGPFLVVVVESSACGNMRARWISPEGHSQFAAGIKHRLWGGWLIWDIRGWMRDEHLDGDTNSVRTNGEKDADDGSSLTLTLLQRLAFRGAAASQVVPSYEFLPCVPSAMCSSGRTREQDVENIEA